MSSFTSAKASHILYASSGLSVLHFNTSRAWWKMSARGGSGCYFTSLHNWTGQDWIRLDLITSHTPALHISECLLVEKTHRTSKTHYKTGSTHQRQSLSHHRHGWRPATHITHQKVHLRRKGEAGNGLRPPWSVVDSSVYLVRCGLLHAAIQALQRREKRN